MISAIICTYNRERYLYNVLQSLVAGNLPTEEYEIVLVNNNSTDGTEAEVRRFQTDYPQVQLRYCVEPQQGLS